MSSHPRKVGPLFIPFILVTVLHLVSQLIDNTLLHQLTKPLLLPLLILPAVLLIQEKSKAYWLLMLGLLFSWFGDLALMLSGEIWFMTGLGMFFVAHVFYVWLFVKFTMVQRPHSLASLYLIWYATLLYLLYPYLGAMLIPVALYGLVLGAMGFFATRSGLFILLGGLLFVASDSLLALNRFLPSELYHFEYNGFLVMLSYCLAQGLIVYGVQNQLNRSSPQ